MVSERTVVIAAWIIAVIATAGSLLYQYGLGLFPCELCWYQRILMYPLVIVLGYAVFVDPGDSYRLALPFTVPGLVVSAYHSYLQVTPGQVCGVGGCGRVQYQLFGLTIPNQSWLAFALITALMVIVWRPYR